MSRFHTVIVLCAVALLAAGCSAARQPVKHTAGKPETCLGRSAPAAGTRDSGPVNRDDVNGDGKSDAVVNGWYRQPKTGGRWVNNRFVVLAAPNGPYPTRAFRLAERFTPPDPRLDTFPIFRDRSHQFTGDVDDDGYADVVVSNTIYREKFDRYELRQCIVFGGRTGPVAATALPADVPPVIGIGDVDRDGALDLITLVEARDDRRERGRQPAEVRYGPLARDHGTPRRTTALDVGYRGWASATRHVIGDFDGDGHDDLVTRAEYEEEDDRLEAGIPKDVVDATYYRGTAGGLRAAGAVPGIAADQPGAGNGTVPIDSGDFDRDGRADILARADDQLVAVYGSPHGPGRGRAAANLGSRRGPSDVAVVGDFNGDGYDDAAIGVRGTDHRVGTVCVLLGGKNGL
ncbi:MAG: VCBS repeat-containing protein, partial [Actinomadura sp.]